MEVFEDGDMPVYDEIDIESDDSSYESDKHELFESKI